MSDFPKLIYSKDVVKSQTARRKLEDGIYARFLVTGVERRIYAKEDRELEKRGSCALILTASPFADAKDARSVKKAFSVRSNIILPVKNPDFPDHKEPNTTFICVRWAKALFPELLPPMLQSNPKKRCWDLMKWNEDKGLYVQYENGAGPMSVAYSDDLKREECELDLSSKAVELFTNLFSAEDDATRKNLAGLAFYAMTVSNNGFQSLEHPSPTMPKGRQYGVIPTE